jgi:hypothetical protein
MRAGRMVRSRLPAGRAALSRTTAARTRQPPPPTAASSLQPNVPQEGSAEYQLEAMQIASNFILKASLDHPTLLSRSETPVAIASTGAAWKADNAAGFVRIVPPQPNVSGLDVAAAIVGNDARECKGKFASARNSELVDSEVVFRGMSSCEDSERLAVAEYFIFRARRAASSCFRCWLPRGRRDSRRQRRSVRNSMRASARLPMSRSDIRC